MKQSLLLFLLVSLTLPVSALAKDLKSLEDLRAEAERGDPAAQYDMGVLYEFGFNLPDNRAPALAWYMLAADQGNARAAKRRDQLKGRMTPEEVKEAERLANRLAAKRGAGPPTEAGDRGRLAPRSP